MNYIFDTVPYEIREGNHQQAVAWKQFIAEASEIRKKTSVRVRKEQLEQLDRRARGYLEIIRREADVERK